MEITKLITVVCLFISVSCSSVPITRKVKKAKSVCYTDTHTNIEDLINIKGYYFNPQNNLQYLLFYDNGLVVSQFNDYNKERRENKEPRNVSLFLEEVADDPDTRDAIFYYGFIDCGNYIISGDTIKVQMIHKYHSLNDNWYGREWWYKVIDENNLLCIKVIELTTNKNDRELYEKYPSPDIGVTSTFIPIKAVPPPDYYWILKEKWFWCNELDWKIYNNKSTDGK